MKEKTFSKDTCYKCGKLCSDSPHGGRNMLDEETGKLFPMIYTIKGCIARKLKKRGADEELIKLALEIEGSITAKK